MSPPVREARSIFGRKDLWINWPSAWHLNSLEGIKCKTIELIGQAAPGNGFIIGITEDAPEERWKDNFMAIMDGVDEKEERGII
ncbi:MAG: hypothetical protein GX754_01250 [Clostridiaceae bacterium]|nr:hypothetical protein [Clostridiaceae bacterium]